MDEFKEYPDMTDEEELLEQPAEEDISEEPAETPAGADAPAEAKETLPETDISGEAETEGFLTWPDIPEEEEEKAPESDISGEAEAEEMPAEADVPVEAEAEETLPEEEVPVEAETEEIQPAAGVPENTGRPMVRYGQPGYRNMADFGGQEGEGRSKQGGFGSSFDIFRFDIPKKDGAGKRSLTPGQAPDENETRRKIIFGVLTAAAAVILIAVIGSGISSLVGRSQSAPAAPESATAGDSLRELPPDNSVSAYPAGENSGKDEAAAAVPSDESAGKDEAAAAVPSDENAGRDEAAAAGPAGENAGKDEAAPAENEGDLPSPAGEGTGGAELSIVEVVKKVMPSMVSITNLTVQEYRSYYGGTVQKDAVSAGSGIIFRITDDNLLIATNYHVIADASDITVAFIDDTTASAVVRGYDVDDDLAVVAVDIRSLDAGTAAAIRAITTGDSDALEVGQPVIAIGNALGYGQSVSSGIVSALNRVLRDNDGTMRSLIQTDASINPGNSGGALLNMQGELVGINEIKYVDTNVEGVGYAIPIARAMPVLDELADEDMRMPVLKEKAGYLGITCMTMPEYYTEIGYPDGVYVSEVVEGGPADQAGIRAQDIITSLHGKPVKNQDELLYQLSCYAAGEELDLSVSRMDQETGKFEKVKVTVTLGSRAQAISEGLMDENGVPGGASQENNPGAGDGLKGLNPGEDASEEDSPAEEPELGYDFGGLFDSQGADGTGR